MLDKEQMEKFLPNEAAIRIMHQRYPIHGTFIIDQMMGPHSAAGWFLAGYIFGRDKELREMGFTDSYDAITDGVLLGKKMDA